MIRMLTSAAVAALLLAGAGRAQDKVPLQTLASDDRKFTIQVPGDWQISPGDEDRAVISVRAAFKRELFEIRLELSLHWIKMMQNARTHLYWDRPSKRRHYETDDLVVETSPLPHLAVSYQEEDRRFTDIFIHWMKAGRGYTLSCTIPEKRLDLVRDDLFTIAKSIETNTPPWPPIPEKYTVVKKSGYRYLRHDYFKGKLGDLHKELLRDEKDFVKEHGRFPKNKHWPPTILVHRMPFDVSAVNPYVANAGFSFFSEPHLKRLFVIDLPPEKKKRKKGEVRAAFAREVTKFFYNLRYGNTEPEWYYRSEALIAAERRLTGKKLPELSDETVLALPDTPRRFDGLYDEFNQLDFSGIDEDCLAYAILFRLGDKTWVKAFEGFVKQFRQTGDWDAATKRHILSLDLDALQTAAADLVRKLKRKVR